MIRFCSSGTSAAPISTPRSPRATITASATREDLVESRDCLGLLDLRDHVRASSRPPRSASSARCTSAAERTNESATKSTPSSSANCEVVDVLRVSDGIGSATPGRLTPLWEVTTPPTSTSQRARPRSTSTTRSRTRAVVDQHVVARLRAPSRAPPGAIGQVAALGRRPRPRSIISRATLERDAARRARRRGASGPAGRRSARRGRPTSSCSARTSLARAPGGPRACRARSSAGRRRCRAPSAASERLGSRRSRARSWRRSSCGEGRSAIASEPSDRRLRGRRPSPG